MNNHKGPSPHLLDKSTLELVHDGALVFFSLVQFLAAHCVEVPCFKGKAALYSFFWQNCHDLHSRGSTFIKKLKSLLKPIHQLFSSLGTLLLFLFFDRILSTTNLCLRFCVWSSETPGPLICVTSSSQKLHLHLHVIPSTLTIDQVQIFEHCLHWQS